VPEPSDNDVDDMKITCGSCSAKYTVSDEKVQGKTVKVKCRKCGAVIVVSNTGEVQTAGASAAGAAPSQTFTVSVSDTDQRTMTMEQIVEAYNEGSIDAETFVWAEGMEDWQPLKDVDAVVDALHEAAQGDDGGSEHLGSTVAMQDPGGYAPAPAAYASSGVGSPPAMGAADSLGGTVAMAQSPYGAPAAAGGFFNAPSAGGGGGAFGGSSFSDVASSAGGGGAGGNGSAVRTEDSAIFSLNMLTQKVGGAAPSSPSTTSEDSGLIDLKALAQGMGGESSGGPGEAPSLAGEGLFPLGAPPPQVAAPPSAVSVAPPASGPGRGLMIALAGLVVVMGAALVFILVRDSGPEDGTTTATTTPTAEIPAPAPTPTEVATPEPTAAESAEAAASASASAKVAVRPPPGGFRPQPRGKVSQPAPRPTPAPKGGTSACGCSPDDLMCHMRCSQKK
jgi:predicted Zn finger-like uncharacterized protein